MAWSWIFARSFHVAVDPRNWAALFLTAWFIYLVDRLVDSYSVKPLIRRSLRQTFCARHRHAWIGLLAVIGGSDTWLILRSIDPRTFLIGFFVGLVALSYLTVNHSLGQLWRALPLKEITIGLLFAAGTFVALLPNFPPLSVPFLSAGIVFAFLCALNCISIAAWERELDLAQKKNSIATTCPTVRKHLAKLSLVLAAASLSIALAYPFARPIGACLWVSAILLGLLDRASGRVSDDVRTALADLVLLTPLIAGMRA